VGVDLSKKKTEMAEHNLKAYAPEYKNAMFGFGGVMVKDNTELNPVISLSLGAASSSLVFFDPPWGGIGVHQTKVFSLQSDWNGYPLM